MSCVVPDAEFRPELREQNLFPLVIEVMKRHPKHPEIQNWTLSVLWNSSVDGMAYSPFPTI